MASALPGRRATPLTAATVAHNTCSPLSERLRDRGAILLVVGPVSCLSHAASTLPVYVQANGWAVRL